jgi:hypothetical protein
VVAAIVVGALVVVGVGIGAAALGRIAGQAVAHERETHPSTQHGSTGPRVGTHRAASPLHCHDACITTGAARAGLRPSEQALHELGTPEVSDDGSDATPGTPRQDYDDSTDAWKDGDPTGDDCMFTYGISPVNAAAGAPPRADGSSTLFLSEYESDDESTIVDQGMRVFGDSSDAEHYVTALQTRIAACRHYTRTDEDSSWDANVTAVSDWPSLPKDVTAIGWLERDTSGEGSFIGIDLQRGDLVVRTTIQGDALLDDTIADFIAATAKQMEALPSDGSAPPNA